MNGIAQTRRKRGYLLATGQVTSYGSGTGVDDGALQKGIVKAYTILTTGQYSGTTNIVLNGKTDAHSNNCVFDNSTGLMWSRTASASVGPASDGKIPWTTTGAGATEEGVFPYCAAANVAGLAGHSGWRVPNILELMSIEDAEAPTSAPNSTAFPGLQTSTFFYSSTTEPTNTLQAIILRYSPYVPAVNAKTTNYFCLLVRG